MTSTLRPSVLRTLIRSSSQSLPRRLPTTTATPLARRALYPSANTLLHQPRTFTTFPARSIDILPDADKPANDVREAEPHEILTQATPLTEDEYAEKADKYFDELVSTLEQMQEQKGELDVEYSAGVLTIETPSAGTYVLNKQPPNKQIWLSSPISGPKRFDFVVLGASMDQKEGGENEDWVYLRDGTSLTDVLRKELGVRAETGEEEII